ncbi:unnamed protein product [Cunninghamella echinulata]
MAITVNTSPTNIHNESATTTSSKDMTIEKELEQLILEAINYDDIYQPEEQKEKQMEDEIEEKEKEKEDNSLLSKELEQSLQTVKTVCLQALDSLLRQLVNDMSTTTKAERRLSDSSLHEKMILGNASSSLLGSIAHTTNSLTFMSEVTQQQSNMKRSESFPAMTTLSNVQKMLDTHQAWFIDTNSDYNLCCSLAALLLHLYRILDFGTQQQQPTSPLSPNSPNSTVYTQLRESMNLLQKEKMNTSLSTSSHINKKKKKESNELSLLWEELDHLIEAVTCLAHDRPTTLDFTLPPPAYHDIIINDNAVDPMSPTFTASIKLDDKKKESNTTVTNPLLSGYIKQNEKTRFELDNLLSAIDRLSTLTPRLNNQRVDMTEKQTKELAAATMGKTIERLSRGRMENQRASLPDLLSKQTMLQDLMSQIQRSAVRSLDNQRVIMDTRLKKKMDMAGIHKLMDRVQRGRLVNQDWRSNEELMIDEMTTMTDKLTKMMNRPQFNRQRYSLTDVKEREIFIDRIFQKVDRMEKRRMSNQDAEWSQHQKQQKKSMDDELDHLFDHINKSKSQLDNQRASFTTTTTTSPSSLILSTKLI